MLRNTQEIPSRFVAYFDMLGTSVLTIAKPPLALWLLTWLKTWRESVLSLQYGRRDGLFVDFRQQIDQATFSDSSFLFTKSDTMKDLAAILMSSGDFFMAAVKNGIPLRGGIAHGGLVLSRDASLLVGPALVRAHQLAEGAQWLGVVVDDEVAHRAQRSTLRIAGGRPIVRRWPVPVGGRRTRVQYTLSWPALFRQDFPTVTRLTTKGFYSRFAPFFGPLAKQPWQGRRKFANAVAFLNACLAEEMPGEYRARLRGVGVKS